MAIFHMARPASSHVERLSPVDTAWLRMEQGKDPADILAIMMLEGEIDEGRFRADLEQRLLVHARFRQRVVETPLGLAPPRWEDEPAFSMDAHVSRRRISPANESGLSALMAELVNQPLDFTRSPWRVCIIDGEPAGTILFTQLHHCMGDGFALLDVLLSLTNRTADVDGAPPRDPPRAEHTSAEREPSGVMAATRRAGRQMRDLAHLVFLPFDPQTRLRGVLRGERRVAWSNPIPLSSVKALAHARGATVNDVLMAALSGALRRYLSHYGDRPEHFRAIVPVNLRRPGESIDEGRGNRFGLVFVDLPIEVADRESRVVAIKRNIDRIKASEEARVSLGLMNVLGCIPAFASHMVEKVFGHKSTLVVTNVPGPRETVYLAGSRMLDMIFWVPHPSGLSCGISILSYSGKVRVGVRSDTALVSDPERIAREFEKEIGDWIGCGERV
jgi:diacylglycerol O-acyltransferase